MEPTTGVTAVLGRIGAITNRFGGTDGDGGTFTVLQGEQFDPFGDQYQAAVASLQSPASSAGSFSQSYGPVVPGATQGLTSIGMNGTSAGALSYAGGTPPPPSPLTAASVQLAINGMAGVPGQRPIGGYGKLSVPTDLAAYGNGQIPPGALVQIGQGGHKLYAPAAASWQNVVAAAKADGIDLRITDSYRSYDEQVDLANRKGLYANGGLAAVPGTSVHGWGMAVDADVRNEQTLQWLRVNGPRFGWVETTPREPWHWEFRPTQV